MHISTSTDDVQQAIESDIPICINDGDASTIKHKIRTCFNYLNDKIQGLNVWNEQIAANDLGKMDIESAVDSLNGEAIISAEMFNVINEVQLQKIQKWTSTDQPMIQIQSYHRYIYEEILHKKSRVIIIYITW